MPLTIRLLTPLDWEPIQSIFLEGIQTKIATFQTEAPTCEAWFSSHVAECTIGCFEGDILQGFATLSKTSARPVYSGVAEVSVYVASNARGKGVGQFLMESLIDLSETHGYWMLQSGIFTENKASLKLHFKNGFREVGRREKIGKLDGLWRDTFLLERRSHKIGLTPKRYVAETFDTKDLTIRNATEEDIEALVDICSGWTEKILLEGEPFEPGYIQSAIRYGDLPPVANAHKDHFRFKTIRLKSDGTRIGFFDLYHGYTREDMIWISIFLIDATYQKQGFGHQVIDAISSDAKQSGYNSIGIGVFLKNWKALKFWHRKGFDKIMGIYGDVNYAPENFAIIALEKKL